MEGDRQAVFLKAFEEHSDALFRHAFFRLSDREKALDLTQDTFVKAWDYLRQGKEILQYKSFLFRVLNNLIIDEYRRSKTASLDKILEENPVALEKELSEGSVLEVESALDEAALLEKVKSIMPSLPPDYQSALSLRFFEGFQPKEIAEILGTSENTVSVRIHRALSKLKILLQEP